MYTHFYNLKEEPFNLTPDPKYLYLSENHRKALTYLSYGVAKRKGFIVMTGEVGTGKTTLLHALLRNLDENTKTVFIFNPILGAKALFKFVCLDLGIQVKNQTKGDYLLEIYQFLVDSYRANRTVVMIIDEAHDLTPSLLEEIRLLSNFETAEEKLIQIILVGQPELSCILNQSKFRPLKQRIALWFYINSLSQKETDEYITSRLFRAGMESSCYTEKAVDEIFAYSKGIPRLINILCDHCLTAGYALDKKKVDEKIVKKAIADLETSEARPGGSVEEPLPEDQAEAFSQGERPEKPYNAGLQGVKARKWSVSSLIFWICVLLVSAMLLLNFGTWLNGRKNLEPPPRTRIKKRISALDETNSVHLFNQSN